MKRRRLVLAAIVAAVAMAAFALVRNRSAGPTHEGKSVAQWFELYFSASLAEREDARDAFEAFGDRAVPYLLSVLTRSDHLSVVRSYRKLWSRLPQPLRRFLPSVSTEETESRAAHELLSAARPSAKVLIPRLKPWLSNPENRRYLLALDLLDTVGDGRSEAVPFLVQALQSTNRYHRVFATHALRNFGSEARAAVPALIGTLDDPATRIRAIRVLSNVGPEARDSIPQLERLLDSTDRRDVLAAAGALHQINPEGNGLRLLIEAVGDPRSGMTAIDELSRLGPMAMPAVGVVLEALKTEAGRNRVGGPQSITIADSLRKISPTNRAVIPILIDKLKEAEDLDRQNTPAGSAAMNAYGYFAASAKSDRLTIASRLVWFDPAEPQGLRVLVETLRSDPESGRREFAAYALRKAGPGARSAIPALKAALNDKDKIVRRAAASALRKVDPAGTE